MAKNKTADNIEQPEVAKELAAEVVEEQPEVVEEHAGEDDGLIPVTKDGQTIRVCLAQIGHHQRMGWTVAE